MRGIGIVCEYNPFHQGHFYHLEESRRIAGGDTALVCVMSGDFVQRGEAAVFDKFARAEAACRCGADLVVELPLPWCLRSAEGFASGAIAMLAALGCDSLSFGSEGADLDALQRLASFALAPESQIEIRARMGEDATLSFARARQLAAEARLGSDAALLSQPNNILAVEYLKAIRKQSLNIMPIAVSRVGEGHDQEQEGEGYSAMMLRKKLEKGEDISAHIPKEAWAVFERELSAGRVKNGRILEAALLSRLYAMKPEAFELLPDASGGVGKRLYHALWEGRDLESIHALAGSKTYTAARMRRMLLCAALGICADGTKGIPPYLRPLAMTGRGREYLHRKKRSLTLPLVSRAADLRKLGDRAENIFLMGAQAHALYRLQFVSIDDRDPNSDWKKEIVFVNNE